MGIKELLPDYYRMRISVAELCSKAEVGQTEFYKFLKDNDLLSRRAYYGMIDTGIDDLNEQLKGKYADLARRCNGRYVEKYKDRYKDRGHMPVYEWVDYCNDNKEKLVLLWNDYIASGRNRRLSVSIDRIDNSKGYMKDNIQFVTHGFNSWKRNVSPIAVTHNTEMKYFMSGEEASSHYGIRRQTISDILRGQKRLLAKEYFPERSTVEVVLKNNSVSDLEDYYNKVFKLNRKEGRVKD